MVKHGRIKLYDFFQTYGIWISTVCGIVLLLTLFYPDRYWILRMAAAWLTVVTNTRFCKIPEDVDGRRQAIVKAFLWRALIGLAVAVFFTVLVSLPFE